MNKHVPVVAQFATVEGRALAAALKPLLFVVERRGSYPILSMVKLRLDGVRLQVTGTDLDIEIATELDVSDCSGEWDLCVDARVVAGIARVAGPMLVRLEKVEAIAGKSKDGTPTSETQLHVTLDNGAAVYRLGNVLGADAFPTLPGERGELIERFGNGMLPEALGKVERVISKEETRYYLNGVNWMIGPNGRWFAATDGHRLLKLDYSSDSGSGNRIIPRKTVELLTRFFVGADVSVFALLGDGKIDIEAAGFRIRSKLIEGTFPDITRVIPKSDDVKCHLARPRAELEHALSRLMMLPHSRFGFAGRAVRFHPEAGSVAVSMKDQGDFGEATALVGGAWPEGMTEFGVNSRYLRDLLLTCSGEVTFGIKDAGAPILVSDGDPAMTRVIMPMRVA